MVDDDTGIVIQAALAGDLDEVVEAVRHNPGLATAQGGDLGYTLLHCCVHHDNPEALATFSQLGALLDATNNRGETAERLATRLGRHECVRMLRVLVGNSGSSAFAAGGAGAGDYGVDAGGIVAANVMAAILLGAVGDSIGRGRYTSRSEKADPRGLPTEPGRKASRMRAFRSLRATANTTMLVAVSAAVAEAMTEERQRQMVSVIDDQGRWHTAPYAHPPFRQVCHALLKHYKLALQTQCDPSGKSARHFDRQTVAVLQHPRMNSAGAWREYPAYLESRWCDASPAIRAAGIGLALHGRSRRQLLVAVAAESARLTHNHASALSGAVVAALFAALALEGVPAAQWGARWVSVGMPLLRAYVRATGRDVRNQLEGIEQCVLLWTQYLRLRGIDSQDCKVAAAFPPSYGMAEREVAFRNLFDLPVTAAMERPSGGFCGTDVFSAPLIAYDCVLASGDDWVELMTRASLHCGRTDHTGCLAAVWYGAAFGLDGVPPEHRSDVELTAELESVGVTLSEVPSPHALTCAMPMDVYGSPATRLREVTSRCSILAVSALHGHPGLIDRAIAAAKFMVGDATHLLVVTCGDYLDVGADCPGMLDKLIQLRREPPDNVTLHCLMGHHELAAVLALQPGAFGARQHPSGSWFAHWTSEAYATAPQVMATLAVGDDAAPRTVDQYGGATNSAELRSAVPDDHQKFLVQLPWVLLTGGYVFVHAGLRRGRSWREQVATLEQRRLDHLSPGTLPAQLADNGLATVSPSEDGAVVVTARAPLPGRRDFTGPGRVALHCGVAEGHALHCVLLPADASMLLLPGDERGDEADAELVRPRFFEVDL